MEEAAEGEPDKTDLVRFAFREALEGYDDVKDLDLLTAKIMLRALR